MRTVTAFQPFKRQSFSLIEAAIILAIIGLIMSGLWAAISAVRVRQEASTLSQDFGTIYSKLIQFSPNGQGFFNGTETGTNPIGALSDTLIAMGIFPQDCTPTSLQTTSSHVYCSTPRYRGVIFGQIFMRTNSGPVAPEMSIGWAAVPMNAWADTAGAPPTPPIFCSTILTGFAKLTSNSNSPSGVFSMSNPSGNVYTGYFGTSTTLPKFDLQTAISKCTTGNITSIRINRKFS